MIEVLLAFLGAGILLAALTLALMAGDFLVRLRWRR